MWTLERSGVFHGRYHVLGGVLSAMDGIGIEELQLETFLERVKLLTSRRLS
ncbi:hypothetical protein RIEGSTA812A_PEG_689 [invertebrate metagenome]|uniref:Toprim domain-containing protein n=1 Tax=invertebrate metagenome TaxID=1711999 RepID=A0A484H5C9_9ZZZZ